MILDYLVFILVLINTFLSVGVFLRNPKAKVNRLYVSFVTFLDLWIVSNFLENEPGIVGVRHLDLFLRLDFVFAIFIVYTWFRFCSVFVGSKLEFSGYRWLNIVLLSVSVILAGFSFFTSFVLTSISFYDNVIHFQSGLLWPVYAFLLVLLSVGGLLVLFNGRKRAKAEGKHLQLQQINFILAGFLVSIGGAILINLFLQTFFPISLELSRAGLYIMTALVVFTSYAIATRRLFELKIIIVRAVSFATLTLFMAAVYASLLFFGARFIFDFYEITANLLVGATLLAVLATLTFSPLLRLTRRITNRVFFTNRYDSDKLIADLTNIMAENIELDSMTDQLVRKLKKEMNFSKAAFLIIDKHKVDGVKGIGFEKNKLPLSDLESFFHKELPDRLVLELLDEGPLKNLFRKADISVAIPIKIEEDEVAVLILGEKSSGEAYYDADLDLLNTFAAEAGIAIQNAKAYLEIQKFSRELEKRVEERTKELKESQSRELMKAKDIARLKDEFVFVAVHELRAPITAIKGFLQLVSESGKKFPPKIKHHFEAIVAASNNMNQLVNDLLEIARSESGVMKVEVGAADILPVIKSAVRELAPVAKQKKIKVSVSEAAGTPLVLLDEKKGGEIIVNLLDNAIKYNREGGKVEIKVYPSEKKDRVFVDFKDTGYGISKKYQEKIFEKFFRVQAKETERVLGTGLGLFISRMLAEKMNGNISLVSEEGKGSTFTLSLQGVEF